MRLDRCHAWHRPVSFLALSMVLASSAWGAMISDFAKGKQEWSAWGDGSSSWVSTLGHEAPGCIALECGAGQTMTLHKAFTLAPGRYRVTAWLRGDDIQMGGWGCAVWLFYSTSTNDQVSTVVKDLHGSFNWSKASYTIDVPQGLKATQIWFRLKASGSLWLDDISVEAYDGAPIAWSFEPSSIPLPAPSAPGTGILCDNCYRWWPSGSLACPLCGAALEPVGQPGQSLSNQAVTAERLLLGFEPESATNETGRSNLRDIRDGSASGGSHAAVIRYGVYNNLNMTQPGMRDWAGYDYLAMDVFSPSPDLEPFAVMISDLAGSSYWNQLNHLTRLAPGWNHLRFHVNRYVGERGSVKIKRYLDLHHIERMWFAVAPEGAKKLTGEFLIDNIRLEKGAPVPAPGEGIRAFDFTSEKFRAQAGFTAILEKHRYHKDVGFGFREAQVWRTHDSEYADSLNRSGIFLNKGKFQVDVPEGRYVVYLCLNALGYWYEHFWSHRQVSVQGQVVLDEARTNVASRLADFLRFQDVEPQPSDNPYDLYLSGIFAPLIVETDVHDRGLELAFSGDQSGVCLNWLIVAPAAKRHEVDRYLQELVPLQKEEFANQCRLVTRTPVVESNAVARVSGDSHLYTALINSDVVVRPDDLYATQGESIHLEGGVGERPLQSILIRNCDSRSHRLKVTLSALASADGVGRIEPDADGVRRAVNQYQCHSYNHETYELAPRYLRRLGVEGVEVPARQSLMVWCQIPITAAMRPGPYHGNLSIEMEGASQAYPVELTVYPYALPPLDVGAGFLGFDVIRLGFNPPPGTAEMNMAWRRKTLAALVCRGFNTWSGMPEMKLVKHGDAWRAESPEGDDLMAYAKSLGLTQTIYTYGGGLNAVLALDAAGPVNDLPLDEYRRVSATAIREAVSNWLPLSVTFSDEAAGYTGTIERDLKRARMLAQYYPFLRRSGATGILGKMGEQSAELNEGFTDLLVSSQDAAHAARIKARGASWGFYNICLGLFTYDRPAFGKGLFVMRKHGMDVMLNWALGNSNNYPYYDLDGREYDAMMMFPRADGELCAALKLEWAAQGVEDCRLMMLLEERARAAGAKGKAALDWIASQGEAVDPYADGENAYPGRLCLQMTARDCEALRQEVRRRIRELP